MQAEFTPLGGFASLLNHSSSKLALNKSALELVDVKPALAKRLETQLENLPNDELAKQALRLSLANLSSSDAFFAAQNKGDDGTTVVHTKILNSDQNKHSGSTRTEPHQVFVDTLTRRINAGLAENESTESLNNLLDQASQGSLSAHSEVRDILGALGKLDRNTSEYINRSESFVRFGLAQESAKIHDDDTLFSVTKNNDKSLNFVIRTNEGDKVAISLAFNSQKRTNDLTYGQAVSIDYQIDGNLNASEHLAFTELLSAVADASDALLNGANFNDLIGLDSFDAKQLSGFDLVLDARLPNGQLGNNRYEYSYEQNNDQQTVSFKHINAATLGKSNVITDMTLNSAIGGAYDEKSILAMIDVIEQADNVAYKQKKSDNIENATEQSSLVNTVILSNSVQTFFKTAQRLGEELQHANKTLDNTASLAKSMFDQISEHDPRYAGIEAHEKHRINQGHSTVVDHHLRFKQETSKSTVAINFNQKTESAAIQNSDNGSGYQIQQHRNYSAEANYTSQESGYLAPGTITRDHWQAQENYHINLATIDHAMVGLDQEHSRDEQRDTFQYQASGQYVRREMHDETNATSTIRNVPNLWMEKLSTNNEGFVKTSIYNGRRAEDLDASQVFGASYSNQEEVLTLIGDLDKLNENVDYRGKKLREIAQVDEILLGKRYTIDFNA